MYPVGTETLIHVKPFRCQPWGYHAMQRWYFPPAFKHCCVVKTLTDTRSIILTDTFKFKKHEIKTTTVTPEKIIVKATQDLALTLQEKIMHHQMN